jgi:hypothetical protein
MHGDDTTFIECDDDDDAYEISAGEEIIQG